MSEAVVSEVEGRTCPMPGYGGLRGAMRFAPYTGYSVGFSRIAEAVHCILGSVTRAQDIGEVAEENHVREELGIIKRYMRDGRGFGSGAYADSLSPLRLVGKKVGAQAPYDDEDARGSVEDIRKNAPKLRVRAERYLGKLAGWNLFPKNARITRAAYETAIALSMAALDSVKRWPHAIGNAYADRRFIVAVQGLERAVAETVGIRETTGLAEVRTSRSVAQALRAKMKTGDDVQVALDPRGNLVLDSDIYSAWPNFDARMRRSGLVNVRRVHNLVDGLTREDPRYSAPLHKLLKELVRQVPAIGKMRFAGGRKLTLKQHTVGEWVRMGLRQVVDSRKLPTLYHGTSSVFAASVVGKGLRPRGEGGQTSHDASGSKPSKPDMVYLTATIGVAEQAASAASGKHGGDSVIYAVRVPDPAKLRPDEDAEAFGGKNWWQGLASFGTVAYQGRIPAKFVKPHRVWKGYPDGWAKWRGGANESLGEMATGDPIKLPTKGQWLYHSTYFGRLEGIVKRGGLAPGHGMGGVTFGQQYASWSRGKMFVANHDRAFFWYNRLEAWAENNGPDLPSLTEQPGSEEEPDEWVDFDALRDEWREAHKDWTVVVLRYRDHGRHPWSPDYEEDHENADDYYWTDRSKKVPARFISVWDPADGEWMSRLTRSTIGDLDDSIGALMDKALRDDPEGYSYEYAPNSSKLLGSLDEATYTHSGGEDFWGDAGAGVLPIARSTGRILAGLRSQSVNEPGEWGVFGGAMDSGEQPKAAAKREMREELGYRGAVTLHPAYVFTSAGGGFRYSNFIGIVDEEFEPRLDWETERTKWVTLDELRKLRPMHFGLEALLKNSMGLIRQNAMVESLAEVRRAWRKADLNRKAKQNLRFENEWLDDDHYVMNTHGNNAPGWPYVGAIVDNDDWVTKTDGRAMDAERIADHGKGWAVVRVDWRLGESEYVGNPKMGKALRKVGFKTSAQAKVAARARRAQARFSKLPKKIRKRLLDPKRKDLLNDEKKRMAEANDGGDCYEAAVKFLMEHGTLGPRRKGGDSEFILVHGEVTGQGPLDGVRYGHAWIERGSLVIDTSNGRNLQLPKVVYYGVGNIGDNVHRYTAEEARAKLLEFKHYGPWDLKTSSGL